MKRFAGTLSIVCLLTASFCGYSQRPDLLHVPGTDKSIKNTKTWNKKRVKILKGMQKAMGDLPRMDGLPDFDPEINDSLRTKYYTRFTILFTVAQDEKVPVYLYIPAKADKNKGIPAMLVLHGTGEKGKQLVDGESALPNRALGKELAERGYVVIAPDYPGMGELKDYDFKNDRYQSGTMKAIFNHMRCIDFLETLPEVDANRIGVIGHSLGGHNAMFAGAFDQRLKVVVSSCGWTLLDYYNIGEEGSKKYGGRLGPWAQEQYMPLLRDEYQLDVNKIPFDFDEVIAALAPRHFFSNSPVSDGNFDVEGVRKGMTSAARVYRLFNAESNLQVHNPDAGHDFPVEVRKLAYQFIDRVLQHSPNHHIVK